MAPDRARRTRVAILGGGLGALSAAFELTAPRLANRYDVTVYLPGWRLGGKCASGRGGAHRRIEEHGLHVWFGFYANAFDLIQRCYAEWAPPDSSPLRAWQDAFEPCNDIVLFERWNGAWKPWPVHLPPDDLVPGTRDDVPPWEFLRRLLEFLLDQWGVVREREGAAIPPAALESGRALRLPVIDTLLGAFGDRLEELHREAASHLLELAFKVAQVCSLDPEGFGAGYEYSGHVAQLLDAFKRWLFDEVLDQIIDNDAVRRYALVLDFWATTVCGLAADQVFDQGFGVINDLDLRAWLARHGAEPLTLDHGALLKGLYDLAFAYREGDRRRPDLAAGKALQAAIRALLEYRGAVLWKLRSGTGDALLTPLYDVLRSRGVRFRFFHQVTKLCASADGRAVQSIVVQPQVRFRRGSYDPIVTVERLRCWPSEPKWHELQGAEQLRAAGVNFEQECNPLGLRSMTLQAGEDFDEVVLAIPIGALPPLCEELAAANARFREMLEHSDTVMTQALQLWLVHTAAELGWPFGAAVATAYADRADTHSTMSQLLRCEAWGSGQAPAEVVYLRGVLQHDGIHSQADADARVRQNARGFVEDDAFPLWPHGGTTAGGALKWDELAAGPEARGPARLDAQFLRANFSPTERYVLTPAGSVVHRLAADQSGFANLKLAGDWTRNGIDGGSVEAAVTSGMQAARAISGHPKTIHGEHGWLVD